MSKLESKTAHQATELEMRHPYAKFGLGALISLQWKQYLMSKVRFENDN